MAVNDYDGLAPDYHWLYDDVAARLGTTTPGVRAAFVGLPARARVLDAACGVGYDAVALGRRGLRVSASDASAAMVRATRQRLTRAGVAAAVRRAAWLDLRQAYGCGVFDAVLCTGNSLSHLDRGDLASVLGVFADLLVPDGRLIADSHHWEHVLAAGDRMIDDPVVVHRGSASCRRTYSWRVADEAAASGTCRLDLELEIRDGSGVRVRRHPLVFHPFTVPELRDLLRRAGFVDVATDAHPDDDRYSVVARKPVPD